VTHLYVANVTKQIVQFAYRVPERQGVVIQPIPIGGQVRITPLGGKDDLSTPEIDAIIDQHRKYGLVPVEEVDNSKNPFHGMFYSVGKPISVERLHKAMKRTEEALEEQGKQMRQEAAIAVNNQIENTIGENLKRLEMSITEEEPRGGYPEDHEPLGEGVRVMRAEDTGGTTLPFIGRSGRGRRNG
jgi:hypothetical protein